MKTLQITFLLIILIIYPSAAQDMFPVKRLTHEAAQQGFPDWSPDGKQLVFQRSARYDTSGKNGLWLITADGTAKKQIFSGLAEHPAWSPDGSQIVFDADTGKNVKLISSGGGIPRPFLPENINIEHGSLSKWSPDGNQIAFIEGSTRSLCVFDFKTRSAKRIFSREGYLPMPGCWSDDGKTILFALMHSESRKSTIVKISPEGNITGEISGQHENFYRHMDLSPDGSLLVYTAMVEGGLQLYILSVETGKTLPLSVFPDNHNDGPSWSPDGTKLAFASTRKGNRDIWVMELNLDKVDARLSK